MIKDKEKLIEAFVTEVDSKASEIDRYDEQDWYSLTLGFYLGKGLSSEDAHNLAAHFYPL